MPTAIILNAGEYENGGTLLTLRPGGWRDLSSKRRTFFAGGRFVQFPCGMLAHRLAIEVQAGDVLVYRVAAKALPAPIFLG